MKRRYLTFSLRTLFILLTLFAVWTATIVNRAREQREAVKAIRELGGKVSYDWQLRYLPGTTNLRIEPEPPGPAWLRRVVGGDFFQEVRVVNFFWRLGGWYQPNPIGEPSDSDVLRAIPYLQRLKGLKDVVISKHRHKHAEIQLKAALPDCKVISYVPDF